MPAFEWVFFWLTTFVIFINSSLMKLLFTRRANNFSCIIVTLYALNPLVKFQVFPCNLIQFQDSLLLIKGWHYLKRLVKKTMLLALCWLQVPLSFWTESHCTHLCTWFNMLHHSCRFRVMIYVWLFKHDFVISNRLIMNNTLWAFHTFWRLNYFWHLPILTQIDFRSSIAGTLTHFRFIILCLWIW